MCAGAHTHAERMRSRLILHYFSRYLKHLSTMSSSFDYVKRDILLKMSVSSFRTSSFPPIVLKTSLKRGLVKKEDLSPTALYFEVLSGQKSLECRARKSSARYALRKGDLLGWQITLRGPALESFLSKWSQSILPVEMKFFRVSNLATFLELSEQRAFLSSNLHIDFSAQNYRLWASAVDLPRSLSRSKTISNPKV